MKSVLVTGGAGFIGSHLVKSLVKSGVRVVVLDNLMRGNKIDPFYLKKIHFNKGDVRNPETVLNACKGVDTIFHFAAVLGVDIVADCPVDTMETEILGLKNVTDAALSLGIEKIIYSSTSGVYGHSAIEKSFTETIQVDPRTSYAIAKRYNEIYLKALHEEKGIQSASLRLFNVYGPGQDNRMVIPRFMEQAQSGEAITVFGDGSQTRDFTYIDDTIEACLRVAKKVKGCEVLNISNEEEVPILELAKTILAKTKSKSEIHFIEAPKKRYDYEVERRVGNSKKLKELTGYKPKTTLSKGLDLLIKNQ
jgi:nucleoside-diphosphate-sugar epimerase